MTRHQTYVSNLREGTDSCFITWPALGRSRGFPLQHCRVNVHKLSVKPGWVGCSICSSWMIDIENHVGLYPVNEMLLVKTFTYV